MRGKLTRVGVPVGSPSPSLRGYAEAISPCAAAFPLRSNSQRANLESISVLEQYVRAMESEDAMPAKWA